jgi:hypothetical protein
MHATNRNQATTQPRLSPKSAALALAGYAPVAVHPILAARAAANTQTQRRAVSR